MSTTMVVVTEWRGEFEHVVCEAEHAKDGIDVAIGNMKIVAKRKINYPEVYPEFLPIALYIVKEEDTDSIQVYGNRVYVNDAPIPVYKMLVKQVPYGLSDW